MSIVAQRLDAVWPQRHGRKLGGSDPWAAELCPNLTQCRLGRGLPP